MPGLQDLQVEPVDIALGRRHGGVLLAVFAPGLEPVLQPLSHQIEGLAADVQRLGGGVAVGGQLQELRIGRGDRAGDLEPCGGGVGPRGFGLRGHGSQGGAVAAEEVELPAEVGGDPGVGVKPTRQEALERRWKAEVLRRPRGRRRGVGRRLGQKG